jgi:hypothetical protein
MKRFTLSQFLIAIVVSLAVPVAARASDGSFTLPSCPAFSGSPSCARALASHERFRSVRVAPGGPADITDSYFEQLKTAGYNTVFLSDIAGNDGTKWLRVAPETIKQWLMLARKHGVSVIALSAFVEPLLTSENHDATQALSSTSLTTPPLFGWGVPHAEAAKRNGVRSLSDQQTATRLRYLSADEVFANLLPWQTFNQGEVIALTPLGDDPFYLGIPVEKQMEWSRLARIAAPGIPTLGLIGEFALSQTVEEARNYWAPFAFSYFVLIMYPYNLGPLWGHPLNHDTSADPDGDLTLYIHDYVREQYTRFLSDLEPSQTVLPLIQTFTYQGEDAGIVPRTRDITLQARLIHYEMQATLGQTDNYGIGYFYLGADPSTPTILKGIDDMAGWPDAVTEENALMEQQFRLKIPAAGPRLRGER